MKEIIGVYILQCKNERYYIGSSKDIKLRFEQHQNGSVKATKYILPVALKAIISCSDSTEARKLEWKIKKSKSRKVIEELISQYPHRG
ncbi:MAG: GIY-YIG nuclease family protein [Bacteroidetes bacterium]|nr:GIY-YIG nuclease family protein [Bacteroidota bacterium]